MSTGNVKDPHVGVCGGDWRSYEWMKMRSPACVCSQISLVPKCCTLQVLLQLCNKLDCSTVRWPLFVVV